MKPSIYQVCTVQVKTAGPIGFYKVTNYLIVKHILIFIFFILFLGAFGQSPGGVQGESYWFIASSQNDSLPSDPMGINFYATRFVNSKNLAENIQAPPDTDELSVFLVLKPSFLQKGYQLMDIERENHLVSIQSDKIKSEKDLKIRSFDSDKAYFISYLESFEKTEQDSLINSRTKKHTDHFEGHIAEIIYYPRLLSKQKRRKVETYLSLKYGISLPLNSDYINSLNDTIWKSDESKVFLHRVTGIGRDTDGNLNHKQSANVDDYQPLTIGLGNKIEDRNELNKETWQDLNYLLWADNGGGLNFGEDERTPDVSLFDRVWKTKMIGEDISSQNITFSFNPALFEKEDNGEDEGSENETKMPKLNYWLVFGPGSSDKVDINTIEFIKSSSLPEEGEEITFSGIPLTGQNESFLFTLVKAPELFALVDTEEKGCESEVRLKIIGGVAPYKVEFYSSANQKFPVSEESDKLFNVSNIPAGTYTCKISDALHQTFEQEIIINPALQNDFSIEDIFIKEKESYVLDLTKIQDGINSDIVWSLDGQEIGTGTKSIIQAEGKYSISYETESGCPQTTFFRVHKIPAVEWAGIYPNPVKANEPFFVKLENSASSKVRVTITDFSGRIIKSKLLKEGSMIYSDTFFYPGTYHVTIESQSEKFQYTLIVK